MTPDPMNTWMIIALAWLALGLLSYAVILWSFPPTPHITGDSADAAPEEDKGRLFVVRDLPQMALLLIPTALVSPLLLVVLAWRKVRSLRDP